MIRRVGSVTTVTVVGSENVVALVESVVVVTGDAMRRTRSNRTRRSTRSTRTNRTTRTLRTLRTPRTSRLLKLRGGVSCFYYIGPK